MQKQQGIVRSAEFGKSQKYKNMTPSTYVGVSVFGLAMALTPLGQAFVTPGSSLLAAHGRVSLSRSSTKVGSSKEMIVT